MAKLGYDDNGNFVGLNNIIVRKTLGANTSNVESLCQHPNINKWSHSKPFNRVIRSNHTLNGLEFARLMTEEDRIDSRYGLTFPQVLTEYHNGTNPDGTTYTGIFPKVSMEGCTTEEDARAELEYRYQTFGEGNYVIDPDGQFYGKPYGGDKSYYVPDENGNEVLHKHESICRLSDFEGYDHYSKNPFTGTFEKVVEKDALGFVIGVYYRLRVELRRSTENYGGLTIDNWHQQSGELLKDCYLCVGVYDYDGFLIRGMLDAVPYDAAGSDVVDKASIKLDSTYHPASDGISIYEFVLTNDTLNKVAESADLDSGLYAIMPFLTKHPQRVAENGNPSNLYPLFVSRTDHNFLVFEDGVWHVRRLNKITDLFLPNPRYELGKTQFGRTYTDLLSGKNIVYDLAYINADYSTAYDSSSNRLAVPNMDRGFVAYAGEHLIDITASKRRCITVGDYYKGENHYMHYMGDVLGAYGRPLTRCKLRREDGVVVDGEIWLLLRQNDDKADILISFFTGETYVDYNIHKTKHKFETVVITDADNLANSGIVKSITFVNELSGEDVRMKMFVRRFGTGYSWNNAPGYLSDKVESGGILVYDAETPSVLSVEDEDGHTYYPYLEPSVINDSELLNTNIMSMYYDMDEEMGETDYTLTYRDYELLGTDSIAYVQISTDSQESCVDLAI